MKTLGDLQGIEVSQSVFADAPQPQETHLLHEYHSDVRQIAPEQRDAMDVASQLFKQHIPPTPENLVLLRNTKKAILLRDTADVIDAYYRAQKKRIHANRPEYDSRSSIEQWRNTARATGLWDDLEWFRSEWLREAKARPQHNIVIDFAELVGQPKRVINALETFFGLPLSSTAKLARMRYSRRPFLIELPLRIARRLRTLVDRT